MKKLLSAAVLALFVSAPFGAFAANAQQEKMKTCNKEATEKKLKGAERKAFMSDCLKKDAPPAKPANAQQEKMKECNKQATEKKMKGADRKKFMSECLKGAPK
jgi:hypothetical protein